ncbi:unnamed protein product [Arabidopsis thaliana]|uniref:Uncharacterized protein n=1 Tax=Arabidopsis thaliana TaxID=3702 RepID=A0A654EK70_ARATH|nr:unnamed protein product [Arabidopsis thaliana]
MVETGNKVSSSSSYGHLHVIPPDFIDILEKPLPVKLPYYSVWKVLLTINLLNFESFSCLATMEI